MSENSRNRAKWFIAYCLFREMRYQQHRAQNEKARKERLHPKPRIDAGYGTWIAFFCLMSLFSLLWMSLFWGAGFLIVLGWGWIALYGSASIYGICETYKRKHP